MQHSLSVSLAGEGPQPANDPRGHGPRSGKRPQRSWYS